MHRTTKHILWQLILFAGVVAATAFLAVHVGGCTGWTEGGRLAAGRESFNATVNALAIAREEGQFTPDEAATITVFIEAGQSYLDRWQGAVEAGVDARYWSDMAESVIVELRAKLIAAQRKENP